jgi:3',5'-cyclic-AMP phosphodiesterase
VKSARPPGRGRAPFFVIGLAATSACLRPSEERALRDEQIGQEATDAVRVSVSGGHAAVRELGADRIELWASAPRFQLHLSWAVSPPPEILLEVRNCMPRAVLETTPAAAIGLSERDDEGRCSFRFSPPASELDLLVAPPDSEAPSPFRFAVMSDVQEAIDRVQDIYTLMNEQPDVDFLLGAGDLTERGTAAQLERFERELHGLDIPYYTTLGNHELGEAPSLFQDYYGRGSQSFTYRGVRFTLLDSASATLDPIVYDWLDDWLELGREQGHVVAMHIPPLDPIGVRNGAFASRNEAAKLLGRLAEAGVDLTVYGHIHSYYHFENAGIPAYVSGGGGAIPERFDQIGRHFLVVDVDPAEQRFDVDVVRVD